MKLLLDMNLSPGWVQLLAGRAYDAVHWSEIGDPRAPDSELMAWAREHGRIVITHDLDFGAILAATSGVGPSVIQIRTRDVTPANLSDRLCHALEANRPYLEEGALVIVEPERARVRILPLGGTEAE